VIADRTACSILTLFIVTATSRPLNKKIRLLSVCGSNNYCGSASAIRSPHTSVCTCSRRSHRVTFQRHSVIADKRADSQPESHRQSYGVSSVSVRFFVVHFVAKRYILQQKCLKGQIGTCVLGTPATFSRVHQPRESECTASQTDRQTDGQHTTGCCQ